MNVFYNPFPWQDVGQVLVGSDGAAKGVVLKDGTEVHSKVVLSNATPYVTFKNLTPQVAERKHKHHVPCYHGTRQYDLFWLPNFIVECPFSRVHQSR